MPDNAIQTDIEAAYPVLMGLLFVIPLLLIGGGIPLALRKIGPSGTYGFRTPRTLESIDTWYSVNFVGGISFILAGLLSIAAILLLHKSPAIKQVPTLIAGIITPLILAIPAIIAAFTFG